MPVLRFGWCDHYCINYATVNKVGYSTKDPGLRAQELSSTGVPHRYVVMYDMLVIGPRHIERLVHAALEKYSEGKEWFRCSAEKAVAEIRRVAGPNIIAESPAVATAAAKSLDAIPVAAESRGAARYSTESHGTFPPSGFAAGFRLIGPTRFRQLGTT
jgi:hypothetical protein